MWGQINAKNCTNDWDSNYWSDWIHSLARYFTWRHKTHKLFGGRKQAKAQVILSGLLTSPALHLIHKAHTALKMWKILRFHSILQSIRQLTYVPSQKRLNLKFLLLSYLLDKRWITMDWQGKWYFDWCIWGSS